MVKLAGAEALMRILQAERVEYVFGLPGSTETLFMDALQDHPEIHYILGLHECVAAGMAMGYARAAKRPGVMNVHTVHGLGSAMPMLLTARSGGVPLIVTAGLPDKRTLILEPGQSGDLVGLGRQFAKWSFEVTYAEELAVAFRRAFKVAMQPPTGPVFVSLPHNVMAEICDFEYAASPAECLSGERPDRLSVDRAVDLLLAARTPIVILGNKVTRYDAVPEVVKLAEQVGASVYQPLMTSGNFPTIHPQYLGDLPANTGEGRALLQSADVLLAIGTQPPILTTQLSAAQKTIQIDDDPWEIAKNSPPTVALQGNIKLVVAELYQGLEKKMSAKARRAADDRAREVAARKAGLKEALDEAAEADRDHVPISFSCLAQKIAACVKAETVVVDESWSYSQLLRSYIDFAEAKNYLHGGGGSIGWGMPAAIGVKLALPDSPVISIVGDGSAVFSFQSLWTAAHYGIPVTFVICANGSYRMVKVNKVRQLGEEGKGRYLGMEFRTPGIDFCQLAQSMGVPARKAELPGHIEPTLEWAMGLARPALVEVVVDDSV